MRTQHLGFRQTGTISLIGRVESLRENELSSCRGRHTPLLKPITYEFGHLNLIICMIRSVGQIPPRLFPSTHFLKKNIVAGPHIFARST